jgi:diaminohydroxyphosphoribosylaminopyrimidine deaminase / 5-amino-6-(5-phosphoribosylamino)uracil reductase
VSATVRELDAMRRAIALSALGLGSTSPNPPVGCVILDRDGTLVGEGYHLRKGESHAEVNALAAAGQRASGGTAVVTLEPCNHHGRTPPCHQALLDAGIARVLIALIDPTSRGDGGAARLRAAGVDLEVDVLADEALVVLRPWLEALKSARPWVRWVYEHGPDGPRTCPAELLTPLRVGVDAVLSADGRAEEGVPGAHGADVFTLPTVLSVQEPENVIAALYGGGVRSLLLHGGSGLVGPFFDRGLVDEIIVLLPVSEPSTAPTVASGGERSFDFLPPGFRVRSIQPSDVGVLISAGRVEPPGDGLPRQR